MDKEVCAGIDSSGIQAIKSLVEHFEFLEDERRRAYKDIERLEVACDNLEADKAQLKAEKEQLVFALGRHTWREMRREALSKRYRRRYGRRV